MVCPHVGRHGLVAKSVELRLDRVADLGIAVPEGEPGHLAHRTGTFNHAPNALELGEIKPPIVRVVVLPDSLVQFSCIRELNVDVLLFRKGHTFLYLGTIGLPPLRICVHVQIAEHRDIVHAPIRLDDTLPVAGENIRPGATQPDDQAALMFDFLDGSFRCFHVSGVLFLLVSLVVLNRSSRLPFCPSPNRTRHPTSGEELLPLMCYAIHTIPPLVIGSERLSPAAGETVSYQVRSLLPG